MGLTPSRGVGRPKSPKSLSESIKKKIQEATTDSRTKQEQRLSKERQEKLKEKSGEGAEAAPVKTRKKKDEEVAEGEEIPAAVEKKPKKVKLTEPVPEVVKPLDIVKQIGINQAVKELFIEGTTIVRTKEHAVRVVEILRSVPERIHAWDTETIHIDAKEQSPVGNGKIICASVFVGPDIDFGNGPRLFIDNYADAEGVIDVFKEYLEDPTYKKCFHNYGFDRHIFFNHGIDVKGFGGDTMHMARLVDPSKLPGSYGLASLSESMEQDILQVKDHLMKAWKEKYSKEPEKYAERLKTLEFFEKNADKIKKINIKETFGFYKQLKDGTEGKILMFPDIEEMHTDSRYVRPWVEYSTFDAEITFFLRETLAYQLAQLRTNEEEMHDLCGLYAKYWLPFGELLTDMEREGFKIDTGYLKEIELTAEKDKKEYENKFLEWVYSVQDDA